MTCGKCGDGRRFNDSGIYCTWYGIILNEKHECGLERGRQRDNGIAGDEDHSQGGEGSAEIQEDGCGAA